MAFVFSLWQRINENRHVRKVTGTKITAFYAAMSFTYCCIQVLFLVSSWDVNHTAGIRLRAVVETIQADGFPTDFTVLEFDGSGPKLTHCDGISDSKNMANCRAVFPIEATNTNPLVKRINTNSDNELILRPQRDANGNLLQLFITDPDTPDTMVSVTPQCVSSLKWPLQMLYMARREDVTAVCYQVWLLFISTVALMTESIPHIGASLVVHVIALMWSLYQIFAIQKFKREYFSVIENACGSIDLIQDFFTNRTAYVIGTNVINAVSLFASMYLTWRLFGIYGWATFKKMGASRAIGRAYKIALVISVAIQLACFFYTAATGIWLDMIFKKFLGARPREKITYIVIYITASVFVIPWLYLAWYGIRRESKRLMQAFFFLSIVYLAGSFAMFKSDTFRTTFKHWPFFASMFVSSFFLVTITVIFAVLCWMNFGIGLPHYFERRNGDEGDDDLKYHEDFHPTPDTETDPEKVIFPSERKSIIAFPNNGTNETVVQFPTRSDSMGSKSSTSSRGSSRLPPMKVDRPTPRLLIPPSAMVKERALTSHFSPASSLSADKPSWRPGDDSHMMVNRSDSSSSFGNLGSSSGLDREISLTKSEINKFEGGRSNSSSSGASSAPQAKSYSSPSTIASSSLNGTRRNRVDLGSEL